MHKDSKNGRSFVEAARVKAKDQRDLTFSERAKNPNRKNKIERSKKKFDDVDSLLFRVGLALSYVEKCCSNDDEQNIHYNMRNLPGLCFLTPV